MPSTQEEIAAKLRELSLEIAEAYNNYNDAALNLLIFRMDPECQEYIEAASTVNEELAVLKKKTDEYSKLMHVVLGYANLT